MVQHKAIAKVISIFGTVRITMSHRAGLRAIVRECLSEVQAITFLILPNEASFAAPLKPLEVASGKRWTNEQCCPQWATCEREE